MKFVVLFIFAISTFTLLGQDKSKTYYDHQEKSLKSEHNYVNQGGSDMYHGDFVEFYQNGKKKTSGTYTLGQLNGDYSEYYENEVHKLKCRYTNGILNGEYKLYYPSGNLQERRLYINGKIQGDLKHFPDKKDAAPTSIEKYHQGQKL